jgi:hypothetical protein
MSASQPDDPSFLPPPSFEFLVLSLQAQAEIHMGLFPVDDGEKPETDLKMARHAIDLLGILQEKTKGNLSASEQRLIENSLTELRFRYLQASGNA